MEIEVQRTNNLSQPQRVFSGEKKQNHEPQQAEQKAETPPPEPKMTPEQYLADILNMTSTFNKRLKFSINRELNEVVVKVVDLETDKVIKEIPTAELQRLHARIKETLGILFDKTI